MDEEQYSWKRAFLQTLASLRCCSVRPAERMHSVWDFVRVPMEATPVYHRKKPWVSIAKNSSVLKSNRANCDLEPGSNVTFFSFSDLKKSDWLTKFRIFVVALGASHFLIPDKNYWWLHRISLGKRTENAKTVLLGANNSQFERPYPAHFSII